MPKCETLCEDQQTGDGCKAQSGMVKQEEAVAKLRSEQGTCAEDAEGLGQKRGAAAVRGDQCTHQAHVRINGSIRVRDAALRVAALR